jgi:hypothetical protein
METLALSQSTQWIIEHGISSNMLEILIMIPVIATLVSISRYLLGFKTYGIYPTIVLGISYSFTGLRYGLVITTIVILTTLLSHKILSKIRMHYITRIAVNYCFLTISIILTFLLIHRFGLGLENIENINPLAIASIAALSDFFIKVYVKKSAKSTFRTLLETVLIAVVGWFLITRSMISTFLLNNLWLILLFIAINLSVGQFKGLRLIDNFRFKSILKKDDDTSKQE